MKQQLTKTLTRLTFCSLLLTLCIFNRYVTVSAVKKVLPKPNIPAVFAFGDSFADAGNNNNLPLTLMKSNFPPYGKDLKTKKPTGRFSNGLILTDYIVQALGIKKMLPAYANSTLKDKDFLSGVTFGSAATGYDPLTSRSFLVVPLKQQLQMFEEYVGKLKQKVGDDNASHMIEKSAYIVVCGSDDITLNYFGALILRDIQFTADKYTNLVVKGASVFITKLYKAGARKIYVTNLPPLQCLPSQRTLGGGILRKCAKDRKVPTQKYNKKLEGVVKSLNKKFPDSKIVLWDIYSILLDIINNYKKYGFEVADKGCCGSGLIEVSVLCNSFSITCNNASKYVFWDSFHASDRANQIMANQIVEKYEPQFF